MAIKNRGTNGSTTDSTVTGDTTGAQTSQNPTKGLAGIKARFSGASNRGLTNDAIKHFMEALNECRKLTPDGDRYSLTPMDSSILQTLVSGIIVSYRAPQSSGKDLVVATVLLLESTVGRLPHRQVQVGNQSLEIPCVTGDAFNEGVRIKVKGVMASQYPDADIRITGAMVVPTESSPKEQATVQRIWAYAAEACVATANVVSGYAMRDVFKVTDFNETDRFVARIDQNVQGVQSAGIVVRSDLAVNVYGISGNGGDPFNTNQVPICTVDTYPELVYRPAQPVPNSLVQPTQTHCTVINISKISSELGEENLEIRLLALASATVLAQQYAWATPFNPRLNRDNLDLRDIGCIAYENPALADGKPGVKIDTRSSQFDDARFAEVLKHAIHPELYFRLIIEDTGEMSWLDSIFFQAAQTGDRGTNACRAIIAAANRLTGNKFNDHYKGGAITHDEQTRIPLGYYIDGRNGRNLQRPLTDIGYLELLTLLGANELKYVTDYDAFMGNRDNTMDQRYHRHLEMLDKVLQGQYTLKGVAYPALIDNSFLRALCAGLMDAGWTIQPSNINVNLVAAEPRGTTRFANVGGGFNGSDVKDMFARASAGNTSRGGGMGGLNWGALSR